MKMVETRRVRAEVVVSLPPRFEAAHSGTREPGWYPGLCREHANQILECVAPRGRVLINPTKGAGNATGVGALRGARCAQEAGDRVRADARPGRRARGADGRGLDDGRRAAGAARLAEAARCDARGDGGHRRLLEAGLLRARGRLRAVAGQRPARQKRPRPQDRHERQLGRARLLSMASPRRSRRLTAAILIEPSSTARHSGPHSAAEWMTGKLPSSSRPSRYPGGPTTRGP